MENEKRKFIKLNDVYILAGLLLLCIILFLIFNTNSNNNNKLIAQISYDGKIVKEIDLNTSSDMIFNLEENNNVNFQISDHKIRFVNTKCPDKVCEKYGYLNKENSMAICLPNKVSLKIIGKKQDIDIVIN